MNNYDRIKSMSVEEMASFICGIFDDFDDFDDYEDNIKQWLLQEVSDEEKPCY